MAYLLVGLLLIVTFAYGIWHGFSEQQKLNVQWQQEVGTPYTAPVRVDRTLQQPVKGVDFAIRVPKLHYFAAVREGVNSTILYSGPGHYPGTVWPGDQGTVGVAAHNVYWINFPQLALRDEIDLETRYGTFRYRVTGSRVVNPDDRTVVVPDDPGYHLVLTTCWPLWAGAFATQRYVIFAEQIYPRIVAPRYL
ncbi:MAG: class D sortase [Candidatus Dormibacteraeota bacterium]|nr:class D sortase [Candidatus Dormibacteraeota bacterium]